MEILHKAIAIKLAWLNGLRLRVYYKKQFSTPLQQSSPQRRSPLARHNSKHYIRFVLLLHIVYSGSSWPYTYGNLLCVESVGWTQNPLTTRRRRERAVDQMNEFL